MGLVYVNGDQRDDTRNNATHLKYFFEADLKEYFVFEHIL